jgi:tRNA G18 (ribose-2'-O)-methylase SpoU
MTVPTITIESPLDPRLEDYRAMRDRDLRGDASRPGVFIGESRLVVERMVALGIPMRSVLVERRHAEWMRDLLGTARPSDTPLFVADESILRSVVGFDVHRGVLAIGERPAADSLTIDRAVPRRDRLTVLLVDGVNNADNMGGLYRNAAAFGVDAIVLSPTCHDHLYRKAIRVSLGHALAVPTARSEHWVEDLRRLRDEWGLTIVAAAIGPGSVDLGDLASDPALARVALLVGNEFSGLSDAALHLADARVRIAMAPGVDSLNVATAAAVLLHRLSRAPLS